MAIRVDIEGGYLQLVDNGKGVDPKSMERLGGRSVTFVGYSYK